MLRYLCGRLNPAKIYSSKTFSDLIEENHKDEALIRYLKNNKVILTDSDLLKICKQNRTRCFLYISQNRSELMASITNLFSTIFDMNCEMIIIHIIKNYTELIGLNKIDSFGKTYLIKACEQNRENIAIEIFMTGISVPFHNNFEAFNISIKNNFKTLVPILNSFNETNENIIPYKCHYECDLYTSECFKNMYLDPKYSDSNGNNLLIMAVVFNHSYIFSKIVENKLINYNNKNFNGESAVLLAFKLNRENYMDYFLGLEDCENMNMCFLWACRNGNYHFIQRMLNNKKINHNKTDEKGYNPLMYCIVHKIENISMELIRKYPDSINNTSDSFYTPLMWACINNLEDLAIKIILMNPNNIWHQNFKMKNAFFYASLNGMKGVIELLIKKCTMTKENIKKQIHNSSDFDFNEYGYKISGSFGDILPTDNENIVLKKYRNKKFIFSTSSINEIILLGNLNHSNIVKYYGYFFNKGLINENICIVMEKLMMNLDFYVKTLQKLSVYTRNSSIEKCFKQILEGLEYLHSKGVIHNDIKSNNIMIDENFNAKIIDFSISQFIGLNPRQELINSKLSIPCITPLSSKIITINSRPYKVSRNRKSFCNDVYALGVTLLQCILDTNQGYISCESLFYCSKDENNYCPLDLYSLNLLETFPSDFIMKLVSMTRLNSSDIPSCKKLLGKTSNLSPDIKEYPKLLENNRPLFNLYVSARKSYTVDDYVHSNYELEYINDMYEQYKDIEFLPNNLTAEQNELLRHQFYAHEPNYVQKNINYDSIINAIENFTNSHSPSINFTEYIVIFNSVFSYLGDEQLSLSNSVFDVIINIQLKPISTLIKYFIYTLQCQDIDNTTLHDTEINIFYNLVEFLFLPRTERINVYTLIQNIGIQIMTKSDGP